jgi:hypothetical protein
MPDGTSIRLLFHESVPAIIRSRMDYSFRVFGAIYGHRVIEHNAPEETRTFRYGGSPSTSPESPDVHIPALYSPHKASDRASNPVNVRYANENFYLFHGLDPLTGQPDWLGEIFDWLSCSYEKGVIARDPVGRIPDSQMIFQCLGLPTWKPQAALQMAWLEYFSCNGRNVQGLAKASSPLDGTDHFVVCSHDIDFYFTNRRSAFTRLIKNLGISCVLYRSPAYFYSNCKMMLQLLSGQRVGDYLPPLLQRMQRQGCGSTLFVVPIGGHRRDPNYSLTELASSIEQATKRGFSVEIHGSYASLIERRTLKPEAQALQQITGSKPLGSRQHWLRFDDQEKLFNAIEEADLLFDSSLGFSDTVGFRNGASFAFPPYDFKRERAHTFLEIPLAIMDGSLIEISRATGQSPLSIAETVLKESRKLGWGGISILWHNPLEALSVPDDVNQVFWKLAEERRSFREEWISTDQFLSMCLPRYQKAGLLADVNLQPKTV